MLVVTRDRLEALDLLVVLVTTGEEDKTEITLVVF